MKKMSKLFVSLAVVSALFAAGNAGAANLPLTAVCAGLPESSPSGKALKVFAEKAAEYSNGSVKVDAFFDADLGTLTACVEGMAQGTIDVVTTGTSYFSGYVPEIQVFELPFMFNSSEEARRTLDGAPGASFSRPKASCCSATGKAAYATSPTAVPRSSRPPT